MANERKLAKKAKSKKNKDRLVLYHTSNNNVESSASEFFSGESIDGRHNEIIQEENDEDDDGDDDQESNEPDMELKIGEKVIAPAITSNADASYSSSFQGEVIEIEGKKACVQCCLSKQHKLWYNIGLLRRPDRSINDAKELKDIKVKGKRKISEIANRKKDEAIRKLELEASDLAELKKELKKVKLKCASLEATKTKMDKKYKLLIKSVGNTDVDVIFSKLRFPNFNNEIEKKIRSRHLNVVEEETNRLQQELKLSSNKTSYAVGQLATKKKQLDKKEEENKSLKTELRKLKLQKRDLEKENEMLQSDFRKLTEPSIVQEYTNLYRNFCYYASARQAAGMSGTCGKTKANEVRRSMGPVQELLNATKMASCKYIRQLSTDLSEVDGISILSITFVVAADEEDEEGESIYFRAAHPVEGKEAALVFGEALNTIDVARARYADFLEVCDKKGLDMTKFPPASEITIEKMNDMSISITDGAAAAKKVSSLLKEHLRGLAEAGYSQEDLDAMPEWRRLQLSYCMEFACKSHSRCLVSAGTVEAETSSLRAELLLQAEQRERLDITTDSFILAAKKDIYTGFQQYKKGHQADFESYMRKSSGEEPKVSVGRAIVGSRQDSSFEDAPEICMTLKQLNELYHRFCSVNREVSTLSNSIRVRAGVLWLQICLKVRTWFWLSVFQPMRFLINGSGENRLKVYEVGKAFDVAEETLNALIRNPISLASSDYRPFKVSDFGEALGDFYGRVDGLEVEMWRGGTASRRDMVTQRRYGFESEEEEDLTMDLIRAMCASGLEKLIRNNMEILSSQEGVFSESRCALTEEEKRKISCVRVRVS